MALTSEQTQALRGEIDRRLEALIAELSEDLERTREEQYGELAGPAPDSGDESVARLIADLDQAEVTRDLTELRELEAARQRLAGGSYGICVDCGDDIGFERLRAGPGAVRCVECQQRYERSHAGAGRPTL